MTKSQIVTCSFFNFALACAFRVFLNWDDLLARWLQLATVVLHLDNLIPLSNYYFFSHKFKVNNV